MNTQPNSRRSVLKMIARLRLIFKRTTPLARRYASITVLVLVVGAMLVALSLAKLRLVRDARLVTGSQQPPVTAATESAGQSVRAVPLAKRDSLVYIIKGDSNYYHTCVHGSSDAERQAVTLAAAKGRNLEPCPVCVRTTGDAARPVVNR